MNIKTVDVFARGSLDELYAIESWQRYDFDDKVN